MADHKILWKIGECDYGNEKALIIRVVKNDRKAEMPTDRDMLDIMINVVARKIRNGEKNSGDIYSYQTGKI